MKIVTASSGKKTLKMSRKEWKNIGKKAGWEKGDTDSNLEDSEIIKKFAPLEEAGFNWSPTIDDISALENVARGLKETAYSVTAGYHKDLKQLSKVLDYFSDRIMNTINGKEEFERAQKRITPRDGRGNIIYENNE